MLIVALPNRAKRHENYFKNLFFIFEEKNITGKNRYG